MKKVKLVGNFYIAYVMAIPFIFGGVSVLQTNTYFFQINPIIYVIALIAFLTGSGREIMKDVQDFEGDVVKVRLKGACSGCPMATMTLKQGIEQFIKKQIPGISSVEAV